MLFFANINAAAFNLILGPTIRPCGYFYDKAAPPHLVSTCTLGLANHGGRGPRHLELAAHSSGNQTWESLTLLAGDEETKGEKAWSEPQEARQTDREGRDQGAPGLALTTAGARTESLHWQGLGGAASSLPEPGTSSSRPV